MATLTTGQFPKRRETDEQQERRVGQLKARMEVWKEEQLERWGNTRAVFSTRNTGNGKNRDKSKYGEVDGPGPVAQPTQVGDSTN